MPRRPRYRTVRIRRPRELARVRDRPLEQHRRGTPASRALALTGLVGAIAAGVITVSSLGGSGDGEADATPSLPTVRAHDADNHVVFRRTGRRLTVKIGRAAPERLRELAGGVRLACLHIAADGSERTYRRRLNWPEDGRFNSLQVPGPVAATMRECSLARGGRTLARATF